MYRNWGICVMLWLSFLARGESVLQTPPELPNDIPITSEVVHAERYPFSHKNQLDLNLCTLQSDKFVSAFGVGLSDTVFLSDDWGVYLGGIFFSNSVDNEAFAIGQNGGAPPIVHNPVYQFETGIKWQPIYGKFVLGSYVQRFRWGFSAGGHLSKEKLLYGNLFYEEPSTKMLFGPSLGTYAVFPVSSYFSLTLSAEYQMQGSFAAEEGGFRHEWLMGGAVGVRL